MTQNTKTAAKRIGIKSTLAYGDNELAITTFGKGNKAEIALRTYADGGGLKMPHKAERFTIRDIDKNIDVVQGDLETLLQNPTEKVGEDYLQLKETLENEFFGKSFPNDNIRIQIIYNILDILKIFGLYVNDIIYCINNLQDDSLNYKEQRNDIVGLSLGSAKMKDAMYRMAPYFSIFGDVFKTVPKNTSKNKTTKNESPEMLHNQQVLLVLNTIRQLTAHFEDKDYLVFFRKKYDELAKSMAKKGWSVVDESYQTRIDTINKGFLTNSKKNLNILFELLGAEYDEDKKEIVQDYYNFSIRKDGKNLGVNMKKIREFMFDDYHPRIRDKIHNSYRSKIYTITDFVLYRKLVNSVTLDQMVEVLRKTTDEEEKEKLYHEFAKTAWEKTESTLIPFYKRLNGTFEEFKRQDDEESEGRYDKPIPQELLEKTFKGEKIPFVMLLSFLCNFLEGKEINELLTAYIHKFENIQSLMDTLKELGDPAVFSESYRIFNEHGSKLAGKIASQLRLFASIGKMKPDLSGAKRILYKTAIQTLGCKDDSEYITNEWLEKNVLLDRQSPDFKKHKTTVNPFRNFIARNVIESRRFMFLIRYTKPEIVRKLMENKKIVRYVLSRLPEKQIDSYYENIAPKQKEDVKYEKKMEALTDRLAVFSFASIWDQRSGIVDNTKTAFKKNVKIERLKALTRLYLTTAYVTVKNLVKVNARYYIAFAAFERDFAMMEKKEKLEKEKKKDKEEQKDEITLNSFVIDTGFKDKDGKAIECKSFALTEYFLKKEDDNDYKPAPGEPFDKEACYRHLKKIRRHFTKKWRDIFREEIDTAKEIQETGQLLGEVRNNADHLNVLAAIPEFVGDYRNGSNKPMTSYFELYHYLLQRILCETEGLKIPEEALTFIRQGFPCNDLIKWSYVSLGYNLPRFKNLTIEALFDEDSVSGKERTNRNESKKKSNKESKK